MFRRPQPHYQVHCPSCGAWKWNDEPCAYCGLVTAPEKPIVPEKPVTPEEPRKPTKRSKFKLLLIWLAISEVAAYFVSSYLASGDKTFTLVGIFLWTIIYLVVITPLVIAYVD